MTNNQDVMLNRQQADILMFQKGGCPHADIEQSKRLRYVRCD